MIRETSIMNPPTPGQPIRTTVHVLTSRLRGAIETYRENRIRRDAFLNLLQLDDKILEDIGVIRAEVENAARAPLRVNASHLLAARAHERRKERPAGQG